jgi:hypothetical protein
MSATGVSSTVGPAVTPVPTSASTLKTFPIGLFVIIATLAIVAEILVILLVLGNVTSSAVAQGALVVALTSAALGVERVLELGWTAVGLLGGTWWPVVKVTPNINGLVDQVNTYLKPFLQTATTLISNAHDAGKITDAQAKEANAALAEITQSLNNIKNGVSDAGLQVHVGTASARVEDLRKVVDGLDDMAVVAQQALDILNGVVDSFKENPAKRLISIYAGVILGLIITAVLRVDVFQVLPDGAVAGSGAAQASALGIIVSGVIVGLGSTPTHEVIKLIQGAKDKAKQQAGTK